jgi:hypothetical protein
VETDYKSGGNKEDAQQCFKKGLHQNLPSPILVIARKKSMTSRKRLGLSDFLSVPESHIWRHFQTSRILPFLYFSRGRGVPFEPGRCREVDFSGSSFYIE